MSDTWIDEEPTDVDKWLRMFDTIPSFFWATSCGHHLNVIEELIHRLKNVKGEAE